MLAGYFLATSVPGQMYFSVEPLLCGSCPDYRLLPLLHGHVPCNQDYTSKENKADRDSTVTEAEGTSTKEVNSTYIDDS